MYFFEAGRREALAGRNRNWLWMLVILTCIEEIFEWQFTTVGSIWPEFAVFRVEIQGQIVVVTCPNHARMFGARVYAA